MVCARRALGVLVVVATLAGCGGSGDGSNDAADTTAVDADASETTVAPDDTSTPTPPADADGDADADAATDTSDEDRTGTSTATAPLPAPEPVVVELADLPALVDRAVDVSDPVATAEAVVGLPVPVPVEGATGMVGLSARVRLVEDDPARYVHDIGYSVAVPIGDVDITLDDNGPGSVELVETYDPIMAELGYRRTASTGSDPGGPGGPNSVNHVWVPEFDELAAGGVAAVPGNVFIWNDENLLGGSESSTADLVAGRRVDVTVETPADGDLDSLAVPVLAAIAREVPVPQGSRFVDARIDLRRRAEDSFDIDRGAHLLDVRIEFAAPPDATYDDLVAQFSDPRVLGPDAGPIIGAEPSFFEDGEWEPTEGSEFGDLDWRRTVLLAERYRGELRIEDDDGRFALVAVFTLDAIAPVLAPPSD